MNDLILSWIRTAVPAAVGAFVAWLALRGVEVDPQTVIAVTAAAGAAATTFYQAVVSTLQRRWPIVGVLLGSTRRPTYSADQGYHPGQHTGRDLTGF
ncbi:hypothetical protein [Nonomuraea antri]|uniref:hypothetical protein n=1 Tax=Nonomuraea antri TaxID=2730852 RepID=UPI001C2B7B8B|nr:hypothetical protein [Nonomuraea antri]